MSRVQGGSILLVKLTPGAGSEAAALAAGARLPVERLGSRQPRRGPGRVFVIADAPAPDQLLLGGRRYDLGCAADRDALVARLRLGASRERAAAALLAGASEDGRDELAQLARVLAQAERGELRLGRLVLSGHVELGGIRGELDGPARNGSLRETELIRLVALFPRAAGQVEHLLLASCYGAADPGALLERYRRAFPRLRSVTGYGGKAPRSGLGAEADLRRWARATSGATAPRREAIFGGCGGSSAAALRRQAGVVVDRLGAQRCPERVASPGRDSVAPAPSARAAAAVLIRPRGGSGRAPGDR